MNAGLRRWAALICLTVIGLGVAGCGSHAVTRAQVIARGDAICDTTLRAVRVNETGSVQVSAIVPLIAREVSQLTALPRPAEDRALLTSYLSAMHMELTQWRALAAAQAAGRGSAVTQAQSELSRNGAPQLAARYGMRDCAGAGATVGSGAPVTASPSSG